MPSLKSAARRFQIPIVKENGQPFLGSIQPDDEAQPAAGDFTLPRLILRTTVSDVTKPGDIILDDQNQRYIVGENGHSIYGSYSTFRLYTVNADLSWSRATTGKDDLTGMKRESKQTDLGTIPCLVESMESENSDSAIRVGSQIRRVVTAAALQLGDLVDGVVVRRLGTTLGVTHAQIS